MLELTGFLGLTRISFFFAHTDPTDPTLLLCGWEISQMLLRVGGSCGFHLVFGLTQISQIPQYRFVGGKSHRWFCAWVARADSTLLLGSHGSHRSHSIALWVGNLTDDSACVDLCGLRWGHIALALTDLSVGPFGQIRPIGQIGRIGHF